MVNGIFCLFFSSSIFWTSIIYNKYNGDNIFTSHILTKMESFVKNSQRIIKIKYTWSNWLDYIQPWKSPETWVTGLLFLSFCIFWEKITKFWPFFDQKCVLFQRIFELFFKIQRFWNTFSESNTLSHWIPLLLHVFL